MPYERYCVIRESMPSGYDPMGGDRFFRKDHAQEDEIMAGIARSSATTANRRCMALEKSD